MALNLATLRKRTLTAVVFVVVMAAGLLWNNWLHTVQYNSLWLLGRISKAGWIDRSGLYACIAFS
jgi:hypothetical protein